MGQRQPGSKRTATNTLLLLAIFNHASWSTLHIGSRYLQVYAKPITFDGQGVLSSAKGFAAFFLFLAGVINSWIENCHLVRRYNGSGHENGAVAAKRDYESASASSSSANATSMSSPCFYGSTASDKNDATKEQQSLLTMPSQSSQQSTHQLDGESMPKQTSENQDNKMEASISQRNRIIFFTLLFAFVSTSRASTNIASSKYTYSYNITLISSLTPVIIALLDKILLRSPFPPLLWPTIILSSFGGLLIAIAQSIDSTNNDMQSQGKISPKENLIGCLLQLLSAVFSAFARILMKRTEHILTPTHVVQTNNISNFLFPFAYTMIHNPSSWRAFRYLIATPKSLLAWSCISIGVYSFASALQVRLVRALGPGFYSSWVAVRVLGSVVLSKYVLGEGVNGWLEWTGIGVTIVTITLYLLETRKWMDGRQEKQEEEGHVLDCGGEGGRREG